MNCRPDCTNRNPNLRGGSSRRHNHVFKVSRWYFQGLRFYRGSNFPFSYWFLHGPYNSAARLRCLWGLYQLILCCTCLGQKLSALDKKLSYRRDSAVQGHSRSLMLIPIESPYATSYAVCVSVCLCVMLWAMLPEIKKNYDDRIILTFSVFKLIADYLLNFCFWRLKTL